MTSRNMQMPYIFLFNACFEDAKKHRFSPLSTDFRGNLENSIVLNTFA